MPLIKITSIIEAAKLLKRGELVIYPTETAYGLGADATNSKAVRAVMVAKGRPLMKLLPVIVADHQMAARYVTFSSEAKKISRRHWPGPLTLVLPKRTLRSGKIKIAGSTLALRVSGNKMARALSSQLHRPLISTSANLSGEPACYDVPSLYKQFADSPTTIYLLAGGRLRFRKPSTIVGFKNKKLLIIRQGGLKIKVY